MEIKLEDVVKPEYIGFEASVVEVPIGSADYIAVKKNKEVKLVPFQEYFKEPVKKLSTYCREMEDIHINNIRHLTKTGKIDYVKLRDTTLIVITSNTRSYRPNKNKRRGYIGGSIERI